jgi:hypothetical protein
MQYFPSFKGRLLEVSVGAVNRIPFQKREKLRAVSLKHWFQKIPRLLVLSLFRVDRKGGV